MEFPPSWVTARLRAGQHLIEGRRVAAGLVLLPMILLFFRLWDYPAERLDYTALSSTELVDRQGHHVYEVRGKTGGFCRPVPLDQVSRGLVLATLSSEDAWFHYHPGVDPTGVARALWLNLRRRRLAYGGSTITQQLAKRLSPQPRTLWGKLVEGFDAFSLELSLSKDQILEQYLNRAYYGRNAYGVEAAAQRFYGKSAKRLSLGQSALLAILPRAPSAYDPVKSAERAWHRRAHVLAVMAERGWITHEEARTATHEPFGIVALARERRAPHLIDHLHNRQLLDSPQAVRRLSIDLDLQEDLEKLVRRHLDTLEDDGAGQGGLVVLDNASGEVLAMVGSRHYGERSVAGAVNVTTALRAPGSTLKPFVYALMFEDGAHPSTLVHDEETHFRGYQPRSLKAHYHGAVPVREALGSSLNVPAVRAAARLGPERVAKLLFDLGLTSVDPKKRHGASIALGSVSVRLVDLAGAYRTLARGGRYTRPRFFSGEGSDEGTQVLSPRSAFLVIDSLSDEHARRREFGLETPLDLPFAVAAKTGTSQGYGDNVAVGFTPQVTVAAWVGNFDGQPMRGLLAMRGAAPLWREAMLRAMRGRDARAFDLPPGIRKETICLDTGEHWVPGCARKRTEYVQARSHEPATETGSSLSIVAPPADARFVIDPLVPKARQRIALRVKQGSAGRVRWLVDGRRVATRSATDIVHWALVSGKHHLRVERVDGSDESDELEFYVEREGET